MRLAASDVATRQLGGGQEYVADGKHTLAGIAPEAGVK